MVNKFFIYIFFLFLFGQKFFFIFIWIEVFFFQIQNKYYPFFILILFGLMFSTNKKWKDDIESLAKSASKEARSLCRVRKFSRQNLFFFLITRYNNKIYSDNFIFRISCVWNSILASYTPVNFDVKNVKCNINFYLVLLIPVLLQFSL